MPPRSPPTWARPAPRRSRSSSPARLWSSDDHRNRPDRGRPRPVLEAGRHPGRRRGRRRGLLGDRGLGFRRARARPAPRAAGRCDLRADREPAGRHAHADDGRLRGLLQARSRSALRPRRLSYPQPPCRLRSSPSSGRRCPSLRCRAGERSLAARRSASAWPRARWCSALLWLVFLKDDGRTPLVVQGPVAFNLLVRRRQARARGAAGRRLVAAADAGLRSRPRIVHGPSGAPAGIRGRRQRRAAGLRQRADRGDARRRPAVRAALGGPRARQQPARLPDPVPDQAGRPHGLRAARAAVQGGTGRPRRRRHHDGRRALAVDAERRLRGLQRADQAALPLVPPGHRAAVSERRRRARRVRGLRAHRHPRRAHRRGRGLPRGAAAGLEAARRLRARARDPALVGPDQELRARGARRAPRAGGRQLPAAPDRPGALRSARARDLQRERSAAARARGRGGAGRSRRLRPGDGEGGRAC